jgi:lipopolysaccharide/colanic/teichoic acid biosynthesis glycosyltransferase
MIRFFDILFSLIGLVLASPLFIVLSIWIKADSKGPVFFIQERVGRNDMNFSLYKFRSMIYKSQDTIQITVGKRDPRITRVGYFIRRYKLDELPQLINVFLGQMSLVGPRPEVRKYVNLYNKEQWVILSVKPGITDYASIEFVEENDLLSKSADPEKVYVHEILPRKIELNMIFISNPSLRNYFHILFLTFRRLIN